jgi:cytidine deaminase
VRADLDDEERALLAEAREAALSAWAPYSRFRVGAVLLGADGRAFRGANVENASYGLTMCAERVALFQGVIAGARPFRACAVACIDAAPEAGAGGRTPCGPCRQLLAEHMAPRARVIVGGVGVYTVAELLPDAFRFEPTA